MFGGTGADRFIFNDIGETGATVASADRIHDFRLADGDRIVLTAIDADKTHGGNQAFHFIGDDAFTDAGQVRFTHVGGETRIFLNTDNDASAEAMIRVSGIHSITAGWFAL
jgi:Ca2+-binding RTX toxin-like protein